MSQRTFSGTCSHSQRAPIVGARLLVGGDRPPSARRAAGRQPEPRQRLAAGDLARDLALHVERAAAPDVPVAQLALPRVDAPLDGLREHGVDVAEQAQGRSRRLAAQARDQVRPLLRRLRAARTRSPAAVEPPRQELLRGPLVPGRVDGVEADQLLQQLDRTLAEVQPSPVQTVFVSRYASSPTWPCSRPTPEAL